MKKKAAAVILVLFFIASPLFAAAEFSTPLAAVTPFAGIPRNPAAIFFTDGIIVKADAFIDETFPFSDGVFNNTLSGFEALVQGRGVAFDITIGNTLEDRVSSSETINFTALRTTEVTLSAAIGYGPVSGGLLVVAGTSSSRPASIRRSWAVWDYMGEAFFSRYYTVSDSTYFDTTLGLMLDFDSFGFSVATERFLSYTGTTGNVVFDWETIKNYLSMGAYYTSPRFAADDQLNFLSASVYGELYRFLDRDAAEYRLRVDLNLNFLPDTILTLANSVDFRGDFDGEHKMELYLRHGVLRVRIGAILPFSLYRGETHEVRALLSAGVRI